MILSLFLVAVSYVFTITRSDDPPSPLYISPPPPSFGRSYTPELIWTVTKELPGRIYYFNQENADLEPFYNPDTSRIGDCLNALRHYTMLKEDRMLAQVAGKQTSFVFPLPSDVGNAE